MPVAVITGAAQGIGKQTAQLLNDLGWGLALIDLQSVDTEKYTNALSFTGDITDETFVNTTALATLAKFNRVDALVNNAGISNIAPALNTTAEKYRQVLEVNLVAPFMLAKAFGKIMLDAGSGSIVNVASVAGLQGVADRSAYNASKHGLIGLTRVGRAWCSRQRSLSWLGQNRNGPQRPSRRFVYRSRHHRSRSDGSLRQSARHRQSHRLVVRRFTIGLCQRHHLARRRRVDKRWLVAVIALKTALAPRAITSLIFGHACANRLGLKQR